MEALLKKIRDEYKPNNYGSSEDKLELFVHKDDDYVAHYWGIEGYGETIEEAIENLTLEIDNYINEI